VDWLTAAIGLVGAGLGAGGAVYGARWSFYKVAQEGAKERLSAEAAGLRAVDMELAAAMEIARAQSPTDLPVQMLVAALPSVHHMTHDQRAKVIEYFQNALRYNGRVQRIIAFGQGKRAFGQRPGAEKPKDQAERVVATGPRAVEAIRAHLTSSRFAAERGPARSAPVT
jgi:hypothetical protein